MPQAIRVEPIYEAGFSRMENVLHYMCSEQISEQTMQEFGTAWVEQWTAHLAPLISQNVALIQITITDLTSNTGPQIVFTDDMPLVGTADTGLTLPNNVTVTTKLLTGSRGRSYRGRVYHIGLVEGAVVADQIGSTTRADLNAAWMALRMLTTESAVWTLSVLSRKLGGTLTPVLNVGGDLIVDSQRRRLYGRGR